MKYLLSLYREWRLRKLVRKIMVTHLALSRAKSGYNIYDTMYDAALKLRDHNDAGNLKRKRDDFMYDVHRLEVRLENLENKL